MSAGDVETSGRERTRAAIIEAASRLLVEGGYAAVTTRGVASAAGVQAPTIYRLFGDKDGLVAAVAEHALATHVRAKGAAVDAAAGTDPLRDLKAGWDTHVEFGVANPTLFATLTDPRRDTTSAAQVDGMNILRTRVHRVAAAGLLRVGEERAAELIHAIATGIILTIISRPDDARSADLAEAGWLAARDAVLTTDSAPAESATSAAIAVRALAPELPGLTGAEQTLLREWLDRVIAT